MGNAEYMGTSVQPFIDCSVRAAQRGYIIIMAELGLKKKEIEAIDFAFDVYDFKGDGKVDAFYAGDLMRACNLNPTLKTIEAIGGTAEKGKKQLVKDEVFPMYKAAKESKDQGGFHDFVEILKLYDKNNDDTMLGHELFKMLTNLGEKLTKEENKNSTSHSAFAVSAWNCLEDNKDDQLNHTCKHNPFNPGSVWQDDQIRLQTEGSPRALNSAVDE